ncbi:hypothetical protein PHMEG_00017657 [Phytophthora megakarya]|uniref:Eukaryotic/viral aspartic protease n=1 Tax=Phytophthora megakarya TaxID=4795 RepID=A0A225VVR6_9STRA|nr:hypothetical protein PHMEG_00017657 [Phytophthora megakarya]
MLVETPGTDEYTGRSVSFEGDAHDSGEAMEEDYDLEEKEDIPEDALLAAGRSSGARPLARNLMEELGEVVRPEPAFGDARPLARNLMEELGEVVGPEPAFGDDDDEEREDDDDDSKPAVTTSQVTEQKTGYRPPMNRDTPAANKVLGRIYASQLILQIIRLYFLNVFTTLNKIVYSCISTIWVLTVACPRLLDATKSFSLLPQVLKIHAWI